MTSAEKRRLKKMIWEAPWGPERLEINGLVAEAEQMRKEFYQEALNTNAAFSAAIQQNLDETMRLISGGVNVHARHQNQMTLLHVIALKNMGAAAHLLINQGAALEVTDENGLTPLANAAYMGAAQGVEVLIKNHANLNAFEGKVGGTALMFAAGRGHLEIVNLLLAAGADCQWRNFNNHLAEDVADRMEIRDLIRSHRLALEKKELESVLPVEKQRAPKMRLKVSSVSSRKRM